MPRNECLAFREHPFRNGSARAHAAPVSMTLRRFR
jgi:hypothetical protein